MFFTDSTCPYITGFGAYIGSYEPEPSRYFEKHRNRVGSALVYFDTTTVHYKSEYIEFDAKPGELVFLPKNLTYTNQFIVPGKCLVINFHTADNVGFSMPMTLIQIRQPELLREKFYQVIKEWRFKSQGYQLRMLSEFYSILLLIQKDNKVTYGSYRRRNRIMPSFSYMENHFCDQDLTVTQLAELSNVSDNYFRRIFIEQYGVNPIKYLQNLRIDKAKKLLLTTSLKIDDISEKCGFNNLCYFSKLFKKITSLNPTEYREQNSINETL